jgi:capsular polysaccharide biosynthesis protein
MRARLYPRAPLTSALFEEVPGVEVYTPNVPLEFSATAPPRTIQAERLESLHTIGTRRPPGDSPQGASIPNARILPGEGLITSADGRVLRDTLLDDEHYKRVQRQVRSRGRRSVRLSGEWASLLSPWSENYFHWIIDCLPRMAVIQALGFGHLPVLVRGPLAPFHKHCLSSLGVTFTCIAADEDVQVDRLVWTSMPAPVNFPTPFLVEWLRRTLGAGRDRAGFRHLLVSRTGGGGLVNETEVLEALSPFGFELVRSENLTHAEQVATFSQAAVIVGAHGAGLTNMVFSRDARVLELFSAQYVPWHYYTLAQAAGHEYWYAVGRTRVEARRTRHRGFEINVPLVVKTMGTMLSPAPGQTRRPIGHRS